MKTLFHLRIEFNLDIRVNFIRHQIFVIIFHCLMFLLSNINIIIIEISLKLKVLQILYSRQLQEKIHLPINIF